MNAENHTTNDRSTCTTRKRRKNAGSTTKRASARVRPITSKSARSPATISEPTDSANQRLAAIRSGESVEVGSMAVKSTDVIVYRYWYPLSRARHEPTPDDGSHATQKWEVQSSRCELRREQRARVVLESDRTICAARHGVS